ncbi:MAG: hypothetical protein HYY93_04285 [Planctomycetes bacterium]|nr:hypothetical protein [Planctomycetota bacterium]
MSIPIRAVALALTLGAVTLIVGPLSADDKDAREAKLKECTYKNDYYGVTAIKPDKKEWRFLTERDMDEFFVGGGDNVGFALVKLPSSDAELRDAELFLACGELDKNYFDYYGKKGLAKAIQENMLDKDYKDIKNLKEATNTKEYRFSAGKNVSHFTFDGVSKKYGNPRHVLIICHKFGKFGFWLRLDTVPGDQKKYAKEIKYVWDNIRFEEKKD